MLHVLLRHLLEQNPGAAMSRARNIKPGFFKNELLVELPFEVRLLFIGLWTMADRSGRLEDRPTKIRMEVFPADSVDVDAGLQGLHDGGFIQRYEVNGKRLIQVLAWSKHQNPHVKEAQSTIPAPVEHGASTVQAPTKADTSPADSLIPDSLKEPTEPNGSDADASPPVLVDPLWGTGLNFLVRKGIPEKTARALLGKVKQACGDIEAGALLAEAEAQDITDPAPWLMTSASKRRARAGPNGNQPLGKQVQGLMALEAMKSGNRMAAGRTADGVSETLLLGVGTHAGG
jgi:hypothetical protein